ELNTISAADSEALFRAFEGVLGRPIADSEIEPRNAFYRLAGRELTAVAYLEARTWLGRWTRRLAHWWTGHDLLVTPTVGAPPPEPAWFPPEGPEHEGRPIASFIPSPPQFTRTGPTPVPRPLPWTP